MGFIKRMFQLSLTQREIVKSKRFMAILMVPIFVFQMSSLNLVLLQVAIAEDGESASVVVEEPVDEPAPEEEAPAPEEPADDPEKEVQPEEEVEPKEEIVPEDGAKSEDAPVAEETPSVLDEIVPDSIPEAIVDSAKETPIIPEVIEDEGAENNEGGRITPEAAYDEVEAPAQTPSVEEVKAEEGWKDNNDGSSSIMVTAGNEYEYKDSGLKIKFTRIDNGTGEITVKEIELTDEQVTELGALSNKAWDITSTMPDGTFEYELTLPVEENVDESKIQLVYAEEKEDLNNEEKIKTVEKEDVKVDGEKNELVANGLDHFTIFILTNPPLTIDTFSDPNWGCIPDSDGANEPGNPGQKDLTQLCQDSSSANPLNIIWSWDDVSMSGGNTADACALFDTNTNGNANYALCVTWEGSQVQINDSPRLYSCNDTKADRCAGDNLINLPIQSTCSVGNMQPGVFGDTADTAANCSIDLSDVGGVNSARALDVCSYPSEQPNSDPSDCVIISQNKGNLEVVKDVEPDDSNTNWNIAVTAGPDSFNDVLTGDDSTGIRAVGTGSYAIVETAGAGTSLANYVTTYSCTKNGSAYLTGSGTSINPVSIAKGDVIVCTFTNTLRRGSIVVHKDVQGPSGEDITDYSNYFTIQLDKNNNKIITDNETITYDNVLAGNHNISESFIPAGYSIYGIGTIAGQSGNIDGLNINVVAGQATHVYVTNRQQLTYISIIKKVITNNGGNALPNDFNLTLGGNVVSSGVAVPVDPGTYTVGETLLPGYTFVGFSGDCDSTGDVTVALGETKTCTITNDDVAPELTIVKKVKNDNGGNAVAGDFNIELNDGDLNFITDSVIDTITTYVANPAVVANTNYTISEDDFVGYTEGTWSCTDGTSGVGLNVTVNLDEGENVTCTITNDDQPGTLIVKKVLDGGDAAYSDFSFKINDGNDNNFEVDGENQYIVDAGTYTIVENAKDGYTPSYNNCSNVSIPSGGTATCTITNTRDLGTLKAIKTIDDGTSLTQWSFKLNDGNWIAAGADGEVNFGQVLTLTDHTIYEKGPDGYHLNSVSCTYNYTDNKNGSVTTQVGKGGTTVCTFNNNVDKGTITIVKEANPKDAQNFGFTTIGAGLYNFSLDDDADVALSNIRTFSNLFPGDFTITENEIARWDLTNLSCSETGGQTIENSITDKNNKKVTLKLEAGENINCVFTNTKRGSITVIKDVISNPDPQDFTFHNNFGNNNDSTFLLDEDNNATLPNSRTFEVLPNEYWVSEEEVAGWQQESASCDNVETIDSINVEPGENVTCTFVNEKYAKIILVKNTVGGDDTFEFEMTENGLPSEIELTTLNGTSSQTFSDLDQDNEYSIEEETPTSWNLTSATCTGGNTPEKITPDPGETVTCTFTNTKDATLTLVKAVTNNNGGSATANDFQAKIDGDNVTWGVAQVVSASSHTASEVSLPGYTASSWGGNCAPDGTVTLSPGENKTCTITNDDQQAYVKVIKTVINNNGGDAKPDHFRLTLEGNVVSSDVAVPVNPGAYTAGETLLPGYTFIGFSGDCNSNGDVTVALGETKTCTLTNDDVAPKLTLIKDPTNDNGGNAVPDDFKPTVGGNGVLSGVKNTYAANTPYVINETQLDGYEFVSITGDAKCPATLGGTITLDEGDDITCTISNDDVAPGLTVVKEVKNDNGGNAVVDDFNIELNDNNLTFGTGVVVGTTTTYTATPTITANTDYTISEDDFAGYTEGTWSCTDGTTGIGLNVTVNLDEGEDVICTITNDDVAPTVTLIKEIIGSSADSVNSFGLTIGDATVNSGVKTDVLANTSIALNEAGLAGYTFTSFSGDEGCPSVLGGTVTLEEGEDITCTIINTRDTGSITVNKIIDMDGNLETIEDQVPGANWQFDVNPYTKDTTDASPGSTNDQGSVLFSNLKTGFYAVYESIQPGYDLVKAECNVEYSQFNQEDGVVNVSVNKDGNTICTFYNVPNGTIHGYKWDDINGNGERDCVNEDEGDFEPSILCEGEDLLPGWTINLYKSNGEGGFGSEPIRTMVTDSSEEHFGWYWFEHLLPGDYKVCEVLQPGWTPIYPFADKDDNCHSVTLPDNNFNGFEGIRNAVDGVAYNFGNRFVNPNLTIAKFNSQWPNIQAPGSVIDYTITVTASENNVNNVKVRDLLPKGFEYVSGSGAASSSLGGGHTGSLALSQEYASPGIWDLGNMQPDEVVTLTYKAKIADNQEPGNYKDLAWADGNDDKAVRVLAASEKAPTVDSGKINDNFVGTQIEMAVAPIPQNVELEEETDTETKTKKKVLGVTTYLPATGTPNGWIMLALAIIIGGAGLMFVSRRRSKNNNLKDLSMKVMLLMIMGMGMIFVANDNVAQAVETIAPNIRLEQPVSPTNDKNLDVGFVVLDIDNRPVTVDCYKKGPSDLVAVKFNTVALPAGGSSGVCAIALDADGNYDLYAMASADGDSSPSNSVSVSLATNTPGTPTHYDRDDEGCTVTFNTANDGGLTKKVVLYRSTEAKFVADNSTKVQEGNFESNVGGSLVDPSGNCDDYFYAIQAVSEAGIGSNFVGDVDVDTETETRTRTVYDETVVYTGGGAIPVTEGQITEGATEEGGVAQEAEGEKAVQGEEAEGELAEGAESEGQVAGIFSEKNSKYWWGVGLIALLSAVYYGYRKYAQKNKKLPFDEE